MNLGIDIVRLHQGGRFVEFMVVLHPDDVHEVGLHRLEAGLQVLHGLLGEVPEEPLVVRAHPQHIHVALLFWAQLFSSPSTSPPPVPASVSVESSNTSV